ncbi:hypothetical protein OAK90_01270 [bacterium]|jgi:hypothetical protein|nr:hypothetical protein [bacterium]MDC0277067.1 hypothetical protein [bacterium]
MKDNDPKLEKLFRVAREAPGVAPPETFADQVMSQVTPSSTDNMITIDFLLPKLAWVAAFVVAAFLSSEVIMNISGLPNLTAGTNELASAWSSEFDTIITP